MGGGGVRTCQLSVENMAVTHQHRGHPGGVCPWRGVANPRGGKHLCSLKEQGPGRCPGREGSARTGSTLR